MAVVKGYEIPEGLYYTKDHAWLKVEGGNKVRVGLNDFAQKLAGKISYVKVPRVGKEVTHGKVLFSLQAKKWTGKIMVPLAGMIVEANRDLLRRPGLLNQDCYGKGWVAVIKAANLAQDLARHLTGEAAHRWIRKEVARVEAERGKK